MVIFHKEACPPFKSYYKNETRNFMVTNQSTLQNHKSDFYLDKIAICIGV